MLATTVSYLSLLETKRHNVATEGIQQSQLNINQQAVNIQAGQLEEAKRHNRETEAISWGNLAELTRHNQVTESVSQFDAATRRSQLDINRYEADTHRYAAVQNAGIGWANVAVNQGNLEVARTRVANDFVIGTRNANAAIKQAQVSEARQQEEVRWHDITAEQNTRSMDIRQSELEWDMAIGQQKVDIERENMIWRNTLNTVDTAVNLFETVTESADKFTFRRKKKK